MSSIPLNAGGVQISHSFVKNPEGLYAVLTSSLPGKRWTGIDYLLTLNFFIMKNIFLGLALIAAIGCSDDPAYGPQGVQQENILSGRNGKEEILPANPLNPYDDAGAAHNLVVLSYWAHDWKDNSLGAAGRISLLAGNSAEFLVLEGASSVALDSLRIESINASADPVALAMQGSGMSPEADSSLSGFLNIFFDAYGSTAGYDEAHALITGYEDGVLGSLSLPSADKKIILTATSVMRHAAYMERKKPKKNEDPDWLLLIGSVAAAIDGAKQGTAQSVAMAAASGVLYNFK